MLYVICRELARWLLLLGFERRAFYHARLPAGGFVLASNHQSFLDPLLLGTSLARPVSFMARDTLFRNPLFGGLIRRVGAFPVRRDGVGKEGMREAERRVRGGAAVLLFVEGTRTRTGEISPIKDGAGLLSRLAGAPVVPAAVEGGFRAWPRTRRLPRPTPLKVAFGAPIPAARFRDDPDGARRELEQAIRDLHQTLVSPASKPVPSLQGA